MACFKGNELKDKERHILRSQDL